MVATGVSSFIASGSVFDIWPLTKEKVPATIDARPKTVYSDVVKVLDQAIDAGFTDITFVGAYPDHIE